MTKMMLVYLVESFLLKPEQQQTVMHEPIPTSKMVAMTLWWLANVVSYCEVSQQFGVGLSTVAVLVLETCHAMELKLRKTICLGDPGKVIALFIDVDVWLWYT